MSIKKVDSYIISEIVKPFLGTSVLFIFIFFMFQTFRLADFLIVHKVPGGIVAQMSVDMILSFLPFVFPVAFLAAVLIGFGRLSGESELVAFKASGISLWRMAMPVLVLAIAVTALSEMLALEWGPMGERSLRETSYRVANTKITTSLKEKTFNSGFYDLLLYADEIDPVTGLMKRVFLYDEREDKFPLVVMAQEGLIRPVMSKDANPDVFGGQILLTLDTGKIYRINSMDDTTQIIGFNEYSLYLKVDPGTAGDVNMPSVLPAKTLFYEIKHPQTIGRYNDYSTELWKRVSTALAPLVFCFLGIGLGTVRTRAVQSRGVLLTLVTIVVYWEVLLFASFRCTFGIWNQFFGMELPNLVLLIPAIFFFWRASW
ncbi:MAG: LptF/LptG family permease [Bdellovibrionota bacterium]